MAAVDPWTAFLRIRETLEQKTGLRADDALFGDRSQPNPLKHRSFRINMAGFSFGIRERQRPNDGVNGTERVTLHIRHDYQPGAHEACLQLACEDLVQVVHALCTSDKTRGWIRLTEAVGSRQVAGSFIETDLLFSAGWSTTLPPEQL